jgi:hypothetical protein
LLYFDDLMEYCFSSDKVNLEEPCKLWLDKTISQLPALRSYHYEVGENLEEMIERTSGDKEISFLLSLFFYPGTFSYGDIFFDDIKAGLNDEKTSVAIQKNLERGLSYDAIKEKLKIDCTSSVPAVIRNKDLQIEELRNINKVKSFFSKYPYASVAEASKTLDLSNKDIRKIINQAESEGEVIKYSNVLRSIEYETLKKKIIGIKMEDPMISDQELAYNLEVPLVIVKKAIQEAVQMMKIENAQNFAFMAHQSAQTFKLVEDEAYTRHKATKNSSSEWLKIMISARMAIVELYGLKEPEKVDILHQFEHSTKEERDAMVESWYATDALDIDFKRIEAKTEEENYERV